MALTPLQQYLQRHDQLFMQLCRVGFVASILLVTVLSLLPAQDLPKVRVWDKAAHLIAYMEIAAIGMLGFRGNGTAWKVVLGVVALGGFLELAQHVVPGRAADPVDFIVNSIGVLLGFMFARLILRLLPGARIDAD